MAVITEQALTASETARLQSQTPVVPGVATEHIEDMVETTLANANHAIQLASRVNVASLVVGTLLIVGGFAVATVTGQWEAVAFGGFGIAGIIASLVTNPRRSISASAGRLVQIQATYLGFISQLGLLNQPTSDATAIERSQRLGDEVSRTVELLGQHFVEGE